MRDALHDETEGGHHNLPYTLYNHHMFHHTRSLHSDTFSFCICDMGRALDRETLSRDRQWFGILEDWLVRAEHSDCMHRQQEKLQQHNVE